MDKLIPLVMKLQDAFNAIDTSGQVELPQIVVVGGTVPVANQQVKVPFLNPSWAKTFYQEEMELLRDAHWFYSLDESMRIELTLKSSKVSKKTHVNAVSLSTNQRRSSMILVKSEKKLKIKQTNKLVLPKECHNNQLV